MFKDDRLISVLSGIVLMAAIGMIVQRSDVVMDFMQGQGASPTLAADSFDVPSDRETRLDVLANDTGLPEDARSRLSIARGPTCGTARVVNGAISYAAGSDCGGAQDFTYSLDEAASVAPGPVRVNLERPVPRPDSTPPVAANVGAGTEPGAGPEASDAPARPVIARLDPLSTRRAATAEAVDREPAAMRPQPGELRLSSRLESTSDASGVSGVASDTGGSTASRPADAVPADLGATAAAPAAVAAPATVQAPSAGAAPLRLASAAGERDTARGTRDLTRADTGDVPVGLFGAPRRASTQAAPDPARPAPAVPLENLLALAPAAPAPAAPRAPAGVRAPDRAIANIPPSYGRSPAAPSAPSVDRDRSMPAATISLARVGQPVRTGAGPAGLSSASAAAAPSGFDAEIPRANPVRIGRSPGSELALASPSSGLGDIRDIGQGGTLAPVKAGIPRGLSAPSASSRDASLLQALADPGAAAPPPDTAGETERSKETPEAEGEDLRVAALPEARVACATPPGLTVNPRSAGQTRLVVVSPCHAGTTAELQYSGVRVAIPLDAAGRGELDVLGFERRAGSILWFEDGEELAFDMPFTGLRRLTRVAVVWDMPVVLDLHAFEFGAGLDEEGHVFSGNRRSFADVRRGGGGFVRTYAAVDGVGQNMQVYSFWRPRGGESGVIELKLDYASRSREARSGTCGDGPYATPAFTVLRSEAGEIDRPRTRRLRSVECGRPTENYALIGAAIDDVIVTGR